MTLRHRFRRWLPLVAALALLPLSGHATNNVNCCNVASSFATSYFGGGNGDEDFFTVPAGPPNLMILLGNSSSMLDFANPLPFPSSWPATKGTCTTAMDAWAPLGALAAASPATTVVAHVNDTPAPAPYDNGIPATNTTALVTDSPPWGLGRCTPRTAATGAGTGNCLFTPASYYYYERGSLGDASVSWSTASAKEYVSAADLCTARGANVAECTACLGTKGYYLFEDSSGHGQAVNAALFRGTFLNLYPPKFIVARKVVKSIATVDSAVDSPMDNVRLGLTVLRQKASGNGNPGSRYTNTDGGQLVVPLGPSCDVYPVHQSDLTTPRQKIIDAVNDPAQVPFWNNGPIYNQLAETLYNVGQYYSSYPASGNPYTALFGSSWVAGSDWADTAAGSVNASWAASGSNQHSFCWACQQSSVVVVTDGDPRYDNNLPQSNSSTTTCPGGTGCHTALATGGAGTGDFRLWGNGLLTCPATVADPAGCGTDLGNGANNLLHKVAYFLSTNDLRNESGMSGVQSVRTYTVSMGISQASHPAAFALLQKTADLGGGTFSNTATDADLEAALFDAANDVLVRATSFSVSNTAPLQTSQNTQLFLARFRPMQSPQWEGHLFRFTMWNEFAQGCDVTRGPSVGTGGQTAASCKKADGSTVLLNPNLNGDADANGKAICSSVWILDGNCRPVVEDATGTFVRATFSNGVLVADASCGTGCASTPFWDAGKILSDPSSPAYRTAADADRGTVKHRVIYTVIDSDDTGTLTKDDRRIEVTTSLATSNAADWARLKAALNVNAGTCRLVFQKMGTYGLTGWDPTTAAGLDLCAKQIVNYVRGWDVLDEDSDGCGGPGFPTNATFCPAREDGTRADGEERDRANDAREAASQTFWKLGDIFHSSPAILNPPASELVCDLALDPQCVATLHGAQGLSSAAQTPLTQYTVTSGGTTNTVDAYEKYRRDHATRTRVALVGGNDGMLHAFNAGTPDTTATADALGNYPYSSGTGEELWTFIPPDLLPKLQNMMVDGHQYYVDGNTMVRDVWADGSGSEVAAADGRKQADEFHTLAIMSERSGGNEYVALDVTTPSDPKFLWMYPQPCSLDVSRMGQSWTGFAPRPPPIGPVKLAVTRNGPLDPSGRGFEERWIVMVNGGYDASLTRGRGIWMMDAWTGANVWKFDNEDFAAHFPGSTGGMWPVPGGAGLLDIGATDQGRLDSDGFFDTATWGDLSGQVFVARFASPDKTTWAAARAFEEQRQSDDALTISNRSEFYYTTANAVDPSTGVLHTYLGSGNRERLLTSGASCGPDNLLGCMQAGCMTDVHLTYDYGSCAYAVRAHTNNGTIQQEQTSNTCTDPIECTGVSVNFRAEVNCNGWRPAGTSYNASITCDASGNCRDRLHVQKGNTAPATRLTNPSTRNRFYGIFAYGGERTFGDWSGAATFDQNRFTDGPFDGTCTGTTGRSCTLVDTTASVVNAAGALTSGNSAGAYDAGWMYEYGHHASCPLASGCDSTDWTDEKTGSGAIILAGCVDWNTFRPRGSATSAVSPCTLGAGTARNYTYLADYLSGVPSTTCGLPATGRIARAASRTTNVPPLDPTMLVSVGANSQVSYSVTQIEPGNAPQAVQVGAGSETNQSMYWLEVPRSLHACRHSDATQCE